MASENLFFGNLQLSQRQRGFCFIVKEADESSEVLGSRRQEELLADKLHPTQAQATGSDLILEFREQRFYLLPLPLRLGKGWCLGQSAGGLASAFVHVDGEIFVFPAGALGFERACATALAAPEAWARLRTFNPT